MSCGVQDFRVNGDWEFRLSEGKNYPALGFTIEREGSMPTGYTITVNNQDGTLYSTYTVGSGITLTTVNDTNDTVIWSLGVAPAKGVYYGVIESDENTYGVAVCVNITMYVE